jgi:flagellin
MSRLSSGLRINSGADDPSGLALANSMTAHARGVHQAMNNAQDALNLLAFADSALNETLDILQRMNDLTVRASNEAILTTADLTSIQSEIGDLRTELARRATAVSFNSKVLFNSGFAGTNAQMIQIGADNAAAFKLTIELKAVTLSGMGFWSAPNTVSVVVTSGTANSAIGAANTAIDVVQSAINIVSTMQATIGVQERKLQYIINDLSSEEINISAARSRITDADMAAEISEFTRLQVLTQSATAMIAQANLQPQTVSKLLGI